MAHLFRVILPVADIGAAEAFDFGARFSDASPPMVGPLGRIAKRPWGEESFYASDPFGNPLCFVRRDTEFTGLET